MGGGLCSGLLETQSRLLRQFLSSGEQKSQIRFLPENPARQRATHQLVISTAHVAQPAAREEKRSSVEQEDPFSQRGAAHQKGTWLISFVTPNQPIYLVKQWKRRLKKRAELTSKTLPGQLAFYAIQYNTNTQNIQAKTTPATHNQSPLEGLHKLLLYENNLNIFPQHLQV